MLDVVTIHVHPKRESLDYDFAILHLAKDSDFPNNVEFIKLPEENDLIAVDENTSVSGWGNTRSLLENPQYLKAVEVPIIPIETCQNYYGIASLTITDQMICAGFPEGMKDSCQGDSGGPMKRIRDNVLIGVVSWGVDCALPEFPGVYAKVSSARSWIRNITNV